MCDLKTELVSLKESMKGMKSALISWGKHSKQIIFEETCAIGTVTRQIKRLWNIPRKIYWLQINGRHESQIQEWPKESSIVIKIRCLGAGEFGDDAGDDDVFDPDDWGGGPTGSGKKRTKQPKGMVRLNILGRTFKVSNRKTFQEVYERYFRKEDVDEVWLPSGKRVDAASKIRYFFPPSQDIRFIDEVENGDPRKLRKGWVGLVTLSMGEGSHEVPNGFTFEDYFNCLEIIPESNFVILPNGCSVSIERKIRWYLGADPGRVRKIQWDRNRRGYKFKDDTDLGREDQIVAPAPEPPEEPKLSEEGVSLSAEASEVTMMSDEIGTPIGTPGVTTGASEVLFPTVTPEEMTVSDQDALFGEVPEIVSVPIAEMLSIETPEAAMVSYEILPYESAVILPIPEEAALLPETYEAPTMSDEVSLLAQTSETTTVSKEVVSEHPELLPGDRVWHQDVKASVLGWDKLGRATILTEDGKIKWVPAEELRRETAAIQDE
jgi:hypothetical protein